MTSSQKSARNIWAFSLALSALVLICWIFPHFWYTGSAAGENYFWLAERTNIAGWNFRSVPVSESAERLLVADRLLNGEFLDPSNRLVRVFSAKRYKENANEIGLFVHTPDRCWTEAGWKIEPAAPDALELNVHEVPIPFERRIFASPGHRELVYFCGLTGGQPLPYRLDHNLSVAVRRQIARTQEKSVAATRASDRQLWIRVWEAFKSRRQLFGPKQFLRISAPIENEDVQSADKLLQSFLLQWFIPTDYKGELAGLRAGAANR